MSSEREELLTSLQRLKSLHTSSLTFKHTYENHITLLTETICDLCAKVEKLQSEISTLQQKLIKPESVQR